MQSTTSLGPWSAAIGTSVYQTSTVLPGHLDAESSITLGWGTQTAESNLHVVFDLSGYSAVALSGSLTAYQTTWGGPPLHHGTCHLTLSQGDADIFFVQSPQAAPYDAPVAFDFTAILAPGQYELDIHAWVYSYQSIMILETGTAQFDVTLDIAEVCGGSAAGECLSPHDGLGCSDAGCCGFVCDHDPFCCETVWDSICASEAEAWCTPAFVTGPIINPWNGHRHRLIDSTYWADALPGVAGTEHGFITIRSELENVWVRDALLNNIPGWTPAPAFIGLSDVEQEGEFVWSSGEPFTFADWYPGEPNDLDGEDVVEMSHLHGRWNDISSSVTRAAVTDSWRTMCGGPLAGDCYKEGSTKGCADEACCNAICDIDAFCCDAIWDETCASEASGYCEPSVMAGPFRNPSTGHRYYILSPTSWSLAERTARELGGHLVTFNSLAEATWVAWAVHVALGVNNYAIGLDDQAVGGTFRWADGAPVTYTAWRSGQPALGAAPGRAAVGADQLWSEVPIGAIGPAVVETACLCDTTLDGTVNGADLAGLLGAWGSHDPNFDFTADGVVDGADLSIMLGAWGSCFGGPACVVHASAGSQQPGCDSCVCGLDPSCCEISWDSMCVYLAKYQCPFACQCP
ncbi:MAG: hypothetical protein JNL80_12220 [Phycisphaerae bacterium]|nr:hypothetical protein [Phycisphaerae bacterium]